MAEFNPYKLEEEKWTPKNVYEILPPNAVSWSDYDFGQGTDNVDQEAAKNSFVDGFVDFFKELFGTAGQILGGAIELGGAVLGGFVDGVVSFIGGIANAIGSIFGGGSGESPDLPLFNPIKTNLEAAIQPHRDKINESWQKTEEISAEQEVLRGQMAVNLEEMRDASARAQEATERAGVAITEAEAASAAATEARETLESYNTALDERITKEFNTAVGRADTAVGKADALAEELTGFKEQHQTEIADAIGKAEQAVADLATLSPKVTEAVDKAEQSAKDVESLTSDVEVTQATADKALTDLKNLSIGGRNLLQRVTMDRSNSYQEVVDTGEVFWTGEPIYKGTKLATGTPPTQVTHSITFEPGDEYTASLWVKGENLVDSRMTTSLLFYSGSTFAGGYSEGDGTVWRRLSATWKNDTPDPVLIRFYFYLNRNPGEITYFTSPQVERGNVVTDWTPPIEDFTAEFSDIREDLDQKYTEALSEAKEAVNALPGINDQIAEIGKKADQGVADAKAVNDKLPAITQKVTDLTTEQGDLAEGLSNAATQEDYNSLNTAFQQEQVKINNLNTSFQEEQQKLNTLSADFRAYQSDLNEKQQEWNIGAQRSLTALEDIAALQKEVNNNNTAFQDFQLGVNKDRTKWEQGATLAISNLTDFSAKQTAWNDAVARSIATQDTVNDNFDKWTDGATKAIQANTDAAEALARINGIQVGGRNLLKNSDLNVTNSNYRTAAVYLGDSPPSEGEEVTFSIKGTIGEGKKRFVFYNSGGNTWIVSAKTRDADGVYRVTSKWVEGGDNSHVNIYAVPSSVTSTSTIEWVKLERGNQATDWTPAPEDLPTQTQVDDAQNEAISANTEALKALGKKSLGASLVPYKTPSTKEVEDYAAGKLDYNPWDDPEYLNAGHLIASPDRGRVARANSNHRVKNFEGTYVSVDSSIEYKVKFHTYASTSGSRIYIPMFDRNGNYAVAKTPFVDSGTVSGNLVHALTLPSGVKYWSGVIKFKSGVTEVRLGNFFWNDSVGSATGTQEFGGLEIVPNIPDANVVNELQDNAIRKNTSVGKSNQTAIKALTEGLDASIELSTVNDLISQLETRIYEEEKARGRLQRKIDDMQNEMIPRTIVSDDRVTYDDYVELDGNTITAKPGWSGQMAITYTSREGRGWDSDPYVYQTRVTRKNVPDGTTRSWTFSRGIDRVDYWIYQGKARSIELENRGGFLTGSKWEQRTERTIASHKVGKTYDTGKIEWKTQLKNANRGTTYRLIVRVTGQPDKTYTWSSVGPLTGLGSGIVTLKFDYEFNLPDDATVGIVAYTNGSTAYRTMVNYSSGILTYVEKK